MKCDMCGSTAVDHTEKVCAKNQANLQAQINRTVKTPTQGITPPYKLGAGASWTLTDLSPSIQTLCKGA